MVKEFDGSDVGASRPAIAVLQSQSAVISGHQFTLMFEILNLFGHTVVYTRSSSLESQLTRRGLYQIIQWHRPK